MWNYVPGAKSSVMESSRSESVVYWLFTFHIEQLFFPLWKAYLYLYTHDYICELNAFASEKKVSLDTDNILFK